MEDTPRTAPPGPGSLRLRLVAWSVAAVASLVVVASSDVGSLVVRTLTPLVAAALLLRGARARGPLARARGLLATALLVGFVAGAVFAVAELVGFSSEPGSVVDWVGLSYVPFAVAGILALPHRGGSRTGQVANGLVAVGALWYLTQTLLLERLDVGQGLSVAAQVTQLGYVLVPSFVLAVLLTVLPRVVGVRRTFLVPMVVGISTMLVADAGYAISVWLGGEWDHTGWIAVVGQGALTCYVLVALVPPLTQAPSGSSAAPGRRARLLETAVPYAPLTLGLVVLTLRWASGRGVPADHVLPVLLIGCALILRHAGAVAEHTRLTAELRAGKEAAERLAMLDPLTGLANRWSLLDRLAEALAVPSRHPVAVALVDINDFKDVNDSHGHGTGDRLLVECARRLEGCVPGSGFVARLGGDEFALVQPAARDGGHELGTRVAAAFTEPVVVGSRSFQVRPSTGIVLDERSTQRRDAREEAERLLAHADVAMYQAKVDKAVVSAPVVVLTGEERARAAALIRLREEITTPRPEQFHVVYQPLVSLADGRIEGVEALLRWDHPELGEISPAHFIPLAEQVGSVGVLGDLVLRTALDDVAALDAVTGTPDVTVSVNLSPGQLAEPDLPQRVRALLVGHDVPASRLVLEITEGALVRDVDAATAMVTRLRALGLAVAVDDFGTGYSSLGYLRRFPAAELKVDREFVRVLPGDVRTAALLRSVVDMAAALGLRTVAEGIETQQQRQVLAEMGFDLGQGYLFSRPVPLADLLTLLRAEREGVVALTG
ncbi:putative bifunctional diguanylate cyclase/phosphodiesterase [Thalassiella azotivora]